MPSLPRKPLRPLVTIFTLAVVGLFVNHRLRISLPIFGSPRPEMVLQNGFSASVTELAWSADGKWVAAADEDGGVQLLDPATGAAFQTFQADPGLLNFMECDALGTKIVTVGNGAANGDGNATGPVKIWDPDTGELEASFGDSTGQGYTAAISNDGVTLATLSCPDSASGPLIGIGKVVVLRNASSGRIQRVIHVDMDSQGIAYSPNGQYLAVSCQSPADLGLGESRSINHYNSQILVYDTSQFLIRKVLNLPNGEIDQLAWAPNSKSLAIGLNRQTAAAWKGKVLLWDISSVDAKPLLTGAGDDDQFVTALAWSPDNRALAAARQHEVVRGNPRGGNSYHANTLQIWNTQPAKLRGLLPSTPGKNLDRTAFGGESEYSINSLAFAPDGHTLVSGGGSAFLKFGAVQFWDLSTGSEVRGLGKLNNLAGGRRSTLASSPGNVLAEDCAPFGPAVSERNGLKLWDLSTGKLIRSLATDGRECNALAFSPDGSMLVAVSGPGFFNKSGHIRAWRGSGYQVGMDAKTPEFLQSVQFAPDSRTFVTAGVNACIWDAATMTPIRKLYASGFLIDQARFSPNDKFIAGIGENSPQYGLTVWDAATGKPLWQHEDSTLRNSRLGEFTPDSRSIIYEDLLDSVTGNWQGHLDDQLSHALKWAIRPSTGASTPTEVALDRGGGQVQLRALNSGNLIATLNNAEDLNAMTYSSNGKQLITLSQSNILRVWSDTTHALEATMQILAITPGKSGGVTTDWITYTPAGYYDCSPGAAKYIRWRVNGQLLPASAEAATYHRPDLVAAALGE